MGRKSILLLALLHLWHVAVVVVNAEEERKEEQKLEQQPTMMLMLNTDMDFDLDDAGLSAGVRSYSNGAISRKLTCLPVGSVLFCKLTALSHRFLAFYFIPASRRRPS